MNKLIACITLMFAIISYNTSAQDKIKFYELFKEKFQSKQYKEAYDLIEKAIFQYSDEPRFYLYRSVIKLYMRGEVNSINFSQKDSIYFSALHDIQIALKLDDSSPTSYMALGDLYHKHKELDSAYQNYTQAIRLFDQKEEKSSLIHCFIRRADIKRSLGKIDDAIEDYKSIIEIDSLNTAHYNDLALCYFRNKDFQSAYQSLDKALLINNNDLSTLTNYGYLKSSDGKYEEAIKIYDKLLKMDNSQFNSELRGLHYNNRGYAKMQLGKLQDALKDINKSFEYFPKNAYAFKNRALVYLKMNKKDLVCAELLKAESFDFKTLYGDEVEKLMKEHCK